MNAITEISNLLSDLQTSSSNTNKSAAAADGDLAPFEQAIDQIVTAENKAAKANVQAAIEKSKTTEDQLSQHQQKIAFLSSQVTQAQVALSSLEGTQRSPADIQYANQLIDFKRQEVVYWQTRLEQAGSPNDAS
jgi:chromosome segregation ATPase